MEIKESFQNRLKQLLEIKHLTQKELSDMTGISRSLINKYLKGVSETNNEKLSRIAKATNVNPVWLLGYDVQFENTYGVIEEISKLLNDSSLNISDLTSIKSFIELYISNKKVIKWYEKNLYIQWTIKGSTWY